MTDIHNVELAVFTTTQPSYTEWAHTRGNSRITPICLHDLPYEAPSGLRVEDGTVSQLRRQWKLDELETHLSKVQGRVWPILGHLACQQLRQ
jgi:hypothetical protein